MKTKLLFIITTVLMVMALASCSKFLDVKPEAQIKDSELFSSEIGFKEALSGVYSSLTYEPLYGREMTFGLMGVLAYEWDYQPSIYDFDKIYAYKSSTTSLNRIDAIWNGAYNAIANNNMILSNIDAQKSIFSANNYNIIKGESLALRAFIHFDLLRIFGASYAENPNKLTIPYVTLTTKENFPQLTVSQVLDKVITDLTAAAELLQVDPILTGQTITNANDNGYLLNRQVHLNYYAVKGLLARVYLYKQDYVNALANAQVVIQSAKFPWIKSDALTNKTVSDLTFSTEHLFALNVVRLKTISNNAFTVTGTGTFYITPASLSDYYNSSSDFRFLYWFSPNDQGNLYLYKYTQLAAATWPQAYRNKLPLIKLPEMYFIAAECLKNTDYTQAVNLINTVRLARGVNASPINTVDFDNALASEYRKEFIGEGQLFFYHKRRNDVSIPKAGGFDLVALKGYKLPIPVSEIVNGVGRVDNQ